MSSEHIECDSNQRELVEKKDIIVKKLKERQDERLNELSKKKEELEKQSSKTENTTYFLQTFEIGINDLKELLSQIGTVSKDQLVEQFDGLVQKLAELQKFVTNSAFFLPSRDLEKKQLVLNGIQSEIASKREELLPKKRFAFKNKKKQSGKPEVKPQLPEESTPEDRLRFDVAANEYRLADLSKQSVVLHAEQVKNKDVVVKNISHSHLTIKGVPSAVHLTDVDSSTIICGPCTRSIFVERCRHCVLVVACQQLRIHDSHDSAFYIHVTSKAIIEDSRELQFAPYTLSYQELGDHFKLSGLNQSVNNWADVDDFNWLVKDKQSPHWSVMKDDSRKTFTLDLE